MQKYPCMHLLPCLALLLSTLISCGTKSKEKSQPPQPVASPSKDPKALSTDDSNNADLQRYQQTAERIGLVVLNKPADYDPLSYQKNIAYFNLPTLPESAGDMPIPPRVMTDDEGRRFYFDGLLPLVETANSPSPDQSEFEAAIREGLVVSPPCATTNSQVLKHAAQKAGLPWLAELFTNPHNYYPTHNNEIELQRLGWSYYTKADWVSPPATVGMWDRYKFYGIPGHSGHIFVIFQDMGLGGNDLVGDNTRRAEEPHGHRYRAEGTGVGFWLPPGVYPKKHRVPL